MDPIATVLLTEFTYRVLAEQAGQLLDFSAVDVVRVHDAQILDLFHLEQFFDRHHPSAHSSSLVLS